ncbi:MAG TPA: GNAT family N-acetyltransferase, partial [Ignavibacteriaceae bacterium]|nr:GNAT family N-acetyltransferase [Ignavibacteriaceae bacterium]
MEIFEVINQKHFVDFIKLPFAIHKAHPNWPPPLLTDEKLYFNKKKNPAFAKNEAKLFLAYEDRTPVGRIMGIINYSYNNLRNERNVRFGYLECYNERIMAEKLLNAVEFWGRNQGMNKIVGPLGFSDQDPEGFIIEGTEYLPTLSTYYNFKYLPKLLEELGYTKEVDYVVYLVDLKKPLAAVHDRIFNRVIQRKNITLLEFKTKRELKPFAKPIMEVMNETFTELYGFEPMTEKEIHFLLKRFLPVIDPRFVKAAAKNGKLVAFLLAIPNLNEGFFKCNGRLFPFGIFHLINAAKKTRQLDLLAAGVKKEFRGQGIETLGLTAVMNSARDAGFEIMDSHHELEDNVNVRKVMEHFGGN